MVVCNKEKRYVTSYYEITIVSCLDNGKYVVRYKNLLKDDKFESLKGTIAEGVLYLPPHVQNPIKLQLNLKQMIFDT
jgi:hypothetical protein